MTRQNSMFSQVLSGKFYDSIVEYLEKNAEGVKEFDLLRYLDEMDCYAGLVSEQDSSLLLFQKHFLLFHALHVINDRLVKEKSGSLYISPLTIRKLEVLEAEKQVGAHDTLSEYYLNLANLENVDEDNVKQMLDNFWEKYLRNDRRGEALKVLDLTDPVSDQDIISRYRKLANMHHPDKGGDHEKIQQINEAYSVLIKS